jgi:hypothetical protein
MYPKTTLHICTALGLIILAGCSKPQSVKETDDCSALQNVIANAGTNFDALKEGSGVTDYDHTHWDTKPIFSGAECDVIGWGGGKSNYMCTWTKTDAQAAKSDYAKGLEIAKKCLGSGWTSAAIPGVRGEGTRFSKSGSSYVVDVRVSQENAPASGWHTSLAVGSPINRDAK